MSDIPYDGAAPAADSDLPRSEQQPNPQPYTGPVDSIADFVRMMRQEYQRVALNKLILSARIVDAIESKKMVGRHLGLLEAIDVMEAQLELLRQEANAARDDDDDEPSEPMMGEDEDSTGIYGG